MGLHPAERVREYRAKGYWNDDMIDALLRARVAEFGDIPAIVDSMRMVALDHVPTSQRTCSNSGGGGRSIMAVISAWRSAQR